VPAKQKLEALSSNPSSAKKKKVKEQDYVSSAAVTTIREMEYKWQVESTKPKQWFFEKISNNDKNFYQQ
jgi:hypothetical protein